jgi:hypothetical protein
LSQAETAAIKGCVAYYPPTGASTEERLAGKDVKDSEWLEAHGIPGMAFTKEALGEFHSIHPETG